MQIQSLKDRELLNRTEALASEERRITLELIEHLREVSRRKLYSDLGQSSLFQYCIRILKMSEPSAQRRIDAMRLTATLPELSAKLKSGAMSLSVAAKLQTFFRQEEKTLEEKREIVKLVEGKSSRDAEKEMLRHSRCPEVHFSEKTKPVSATLTQIQFTANEEQMARFQEAREVLSNQHPDLNWAELFSVLADKVIGDSRRTIPPTVKVNPTMRVPTASLKRVIWARDGAKCVKCGSKRALQVDHRHPWALGGMTTKENLRLLCRNCNQREAILTFGIEKMERMVKRRE